MRDLQHPVDRFEKSRLPRPVGTPDYSELTVPDLDRDILYDRIFGTFVGRIDIFQADPEKELKVKEISELTGKSREATSQLLTKMRRTNEIVQGSVYGSYKLPFPS